MRIPESSERCPVVVTIHGGFWKSKYGLEEIDRLDEDLVRRGYATWNIEYRRVGENGGGWAGTFHDVVDAVNHLSQIDEHFPLDLSRVVILGHSAGGHLALWMASRISKIQRDEMGSPLLIPIQGVISLAGVSDLQKMWKIHVKKGISSPVASFIGGTPKEVPDRYRLASPIELLPLNIEQILVHGDLDCDVPVELSVEYHRRAIELGDKVNLVVIPGAEHFKIIDPLSSAWGSVTDSLETLLWRKSRSRP
ncbi:alpha/beta hydrolase family protein [Sporolactobacillus shoreae]|uniref:alpha/beta hydrolase family protein n=1 Tax=Sporolactobacillus shoreae TaxID=1465501 RepID=UPI001F4F91ED|nr:alpha/beta hydrolase [Sporolactobacillus shoreae]